MDQLRRSGRSAVMSIGTITVAFITLGGFLLLSVNVQRVVDRWRDAAELSVYLQDAIARGHPAPISSKSCGSMRAVAGVEYVSKPQALERFRGDFPELTDVARVALGESVSGRLRSQACGREPPLPTRRRPWPRS